MTADVPRDMNALAEAVDAKAGVAGGLALLGVDGKVPADQLNVKDPVDASTTQKGIVQLSNAISDTSTTKAATPAAVKAVYDLAVAGMRLRNINSGTNLDTLTQTGLYRIVEKSKFPNAPDDYGILQVNADTPGYVTHKFIAVLSAKEYTRGRNESGTWTGWRELLTISGGDLQSTLSVLLGDLGTTAGNTQDLATFKSGTSNLTGLIIRQVRVSNGTTWESTATDLLRRTDATDQAILRFQGDDIKFQNADSSWTSLRDLKQSGDNAKQIAVDSVNAKRGSASTAMSWAEIGTAIRNISPVKAMINQSYQITNNPSEAGEFVYGQKWFVFPANTTIISFTPTDTVVGTMDSYLKITRNNATEDGGTPLWRLEDANGVGVNCEMVKNLAGAEESKSIRSWTLDARNREVTVIYYQYHAQGIMRTETISIPSNFDFSREISLWSGGRMGSNTSPAVYSVALKGNLLYV
ncbi:pyocin knob domain-containing protein [Paenibacillus polymyxa]|uniref:pyocin knob domain-containing protein n=1 Tax=Paenibacillus polymyxa TaxID=1406 RepID=UPI002ED130CE|nr:pyocin knob domain-containing protein [Paenibacillus polymyxa]